MTISHRCPRFGQWYQVRESNFYNEHHDTLGFADHTKGNTKKDFSFLLSETVYIWSLIGPTGMSGLMMVTDKNDRLNELWVGLKVAGHSRYNFEKKKNY